MNEAHEIPQHLLGGQQVAILALDGVEQSELAQPRAALQEMGVITRLLSARRGSVQGVEHGRPADTFAVDMTFDKADAFAFDGVLLPGGEKNAAALRHHPQAQAFVRAMDEQGKPLAVICHGPWLLASAGLVQGRRMTSYPALADELRQAGARWEDAPAVRDGHWISSRTPQDLDAFIQGFKELLAERMKRSVAGTADDTLTAVGIDG
ncbi:type 1 glutamine amidotransferase domain-containing protein [Ramlibacter tataouinensis]|uniref:DJ-1/PfpI domain-containing protein n=1 Tax=Ramlibacter tataouinensis (strain ATCC BAA-407 / DSM 14655 / LMG 21543 / TTB310) TaxID=365046 RepID=F5XYI1_RAMTT|nr:type 1 glutamine amidotransferase domain-containing protein [Ramlibacter tataouinensis]AEG93157.1 conserved hypothetical protein [Ramlibacter tataouinensis TTB310]